jgi:hypothetical protein
MVYVLIPTRAASRLMSLFPSETVIPWLRFGLYIVFALSIRCGTDEVQAAGEMFQRVSSTSPSWSRVQRLTSERA